MYKIVIFSTEFENRKVPLMYLLDEHNHPVEIIDIIEAGRGLIEDICTVKKVLPKVSACIGKLENSGEMCYLPFDRIKADSFIVRHSEKKPACEEDKLSVYVYRSAKDGKYCMVNCEPKREPLDFKEDISEIICSSEDEVRLLKENLGGRLKVNTCELVRGNNCESVKETAKEVLRNLFGEFVPGASGEGVIVRIYQDESYPMKDMYGLDKAFEELSKSRIYLKSGGNICIDKAVAATLIDVNSGNSTGKADALKVNIEAAIEIARQIRLKNISGQIVVDFINMDDENDKASVIDALSNAVANDRAKIRFFGFTAMGLFEMTRSSGVTGIVLV